MLTFTAGESKIPNEAVKNVILYSRRRDFVVNFKKNN
jgi:hypothetical protein